MNYAELGQIIERHHRARLAWIQAIAREIEEIAGQYESPAIEHVAGRRAEAKSPELLEEHLDASIAYETAFGTLRLREVEAHERATAWARIQEEA